VKKKKTQKVG
jgi:hypothetical protein